MRFLERLMESEDSVGNKHYRRDFAIAISLVAATLTAIAAALMTM